MEHRLSAKVNADRTAWHFECSCGEVGDEEYAKPSQALIAGLEHVPEEER